MAMQAQVGHQRVRRHEERDVESEASTSRPKDTASVTELKHDLDDILDEIDEILEENAEEFVKGYVQKGGQ
jgi:prokaryotic ubiquitin-like protein Pup